MHARKPNPDFDPAHVEHETDADDLEFGAEMPSVDPTGEGAEIVTEREAHPEPPLTDRGYRNLNE